MLARGFRFSVFSRNFCTDLNLQPVNSKPLHPYKQILTNKAVIDHLTRNIIYKDVFCKPPDVAKSRIINPKSTVNLIPRVFMDDLMPDIAKLVPDLKDITITKFPERYTSGIIIVSSKAALPFIEKCKRRAKTGTESCDRYLTITQGHPITNRGVFKLAVTLADKEVNRRRIPILVDTWSSEDMKKQRVSVFRAHHSVVSTGPCSSLLKLSISSTAANAIRLYLATKLMSPLLGDNIFASRVNDVLGVPLLIDPWSDVANSPKRLPKTFLDMLNLNSNETNLVPPMVHLEHVTLPGYLKGKDLLLHAPVPSMFSWTCDQLELSLNDNLLNCGEYSL